MYAHCVCQQPLKPRLPALSVDNYVTTKSDVISLSQSPTDSAPSDTLQTAGATDVVQKPEAEMIGKMTSAYRISSDSSHSDDVFVADVGNATEFNVGVDAMQLATTDESSTATGE